MKTCYLLQFNEAYFNHDGIPPQEDIFLLGFEVNREVVLKSIFLYGVTSACHLLARVYSTLKMEAIFSSETTVDFQRTTQHYISEGGTLQSFLMFSVLFPE
jgi:hypothetical protein